MIDKDVSLTVERRVLAVVPEGHNHERGLFYES